MAKNLTGLATPGDYILGRGKVYAALLTSGVPAETGWRDLGNAPEFTVNIETETLEHQSSREGLQTVDKEVTLSIKMNLAFTLDEFNDENVALFMQGETASHTNVAVAGFSEYEMISAVTLGRWYDIVNSSGERAYDIDTADLDVDNGTDDTDLVEGVDYDLDLKMGRIFLRSGATAIEAGEALDVALAADAGAAATADEVRGLTAGSVQVAIKFIAENPASSNKQREYQFHTVTLQSEGDVALIGQEFATMGFSGAVESNTVADADAPYVRIRDHVNS